MKSAQIFQAVEETRFLKKLSAYERLFFIGNSAPLEYMQKFFANEAPLRHRESVRNFYFDLESNSLRDLTHFSSLKQYQAIVVVSLEDEALLSTQVKQQLTGIDCPPILNLFGDIFVNLLCQIPLLEPLSPQLRSPEISYAIFTTPRSGSTYLCNLLESTGIAGYPGEHLRFAAQELARYCNFDYLKLLDSLRSYRVTNNGVFGTKLISHFLLELKQTKPDFQQIFPAIDKFILLVRQDKVAQAVSLVIAQRTEIWHLRGNGQNANYQAKLENIAIDDALLDDVAQKHEFILRQEARLQKILDLQNIEPLTIVYEDILQDARREIERILDFLAIDDRDNQLQIDSNIKRMPSAVSQKIIQRYREKSRVC